MTTTFQKLLDFRVAPVAVLFCDTPPDGVEPIDEPAVSGCSYWKFAADGKVFYTQSSDHYGCPIGSFTHGIELPPEKADELQQLVGTMVQLEYLKMDSSSRFIAEDCKARLAWDSHVENWEYVGRWIGETVGEQDDEIKSVVGDFGKLCTQRRNCRSPGCARQVDGHRRRDALMSRGGT